jgi:hypothetical protein
MPKSTNKSIADTEATRSHHVEESSRPERQASGREVGPGARDDRGRKLEKEVSRNAKRK